MISLKTFLLLVIFLFWQINIHSTTRYVKAGNPTPLPPYTSWATASDSIQKCINVSSIDDTIYLGAGVYKEVIRLLDHMKLIGAGMDSCIFDLREYTGGAGTVITMPGGGLVSGVSFNLKRFTNLNRCINSGEVNVTIENIKVISADNGIRIYHGNAIIRNNIFLKCTPLDDGTGSHANIYFNDNYVTLGPGELEAANIVGADYFEAKNNIVMGMDDQRKLFSFSGWVGEVAIYNNVIYGDNSDYLQGISGGMYGKIINNVVYSPVLVQNPQYGFRSMSTPAYMPEIANNIVHRVRTGISTPLATDTVNDVHHNVFSENREITNSAIRGDTNYTFDPMIVSGAGDFRLQKFSPAIDAGDPAITDIDGSRSDIGLFGGPFGSTYPYPDLPPRTPTGLVSQRSGDTVIIKWKKNTEADFRNYIIYRDSISNFTADSTKIVLETTDTSSVFTLKMGMNSFRIAAIDNQGNISAASTAINITVTGAEDEERIDYYNEEDVEQNYPNPFINTTTIPIYLSGERDVRIELYGVTGESLGYIINGRYGAGYHEIKVSPEKQKTTLPSGIYLYSYTIKSTDGTPVKHGVRKMIMLK